MAKNTICLWYDKDAEAAARCYAETFPNSAVGAVHRAPSDYPSGKEGDVLMVEFTVAGVPCIGLNGGPAFKHNEAFSFQIATDDQQETDRYWNAIVGNGGQESACGWCKDKWGVSWQITPRVLTEALAAGGAEAKRAFDTMMGMKKSTSPRSKRRGAADVQNKNFLGWPCLGPAQSSRVRDDSQFFRASRPRGNGATCGAIVAPHELGSGT
jgi:predicted 3-demethylubiquinone-9 3-methyltransferase (glyoxalase superfamily)